MTKRSENHAYMYKRLAVSCEKAGEMKHCRTCRQDKFVRDFSSYTLGGKRYWHSRCIHCRSEVYKRSKLCKIKRQAILDLKSVPCTACGQSFHPAAMRLVSRVRPAPFSLEAAWTGRSLSNIHEAAKYHDAVCCNCMEIKAFQQAENKRPIKSKLAILPPDLYELLQTPDPQRKATSR